EAQRREVVRLFLLVDHLQDGRGAAAAIFLGPGDAGVTGRRLPVLPGLGLLQEIGIVAAGAEAALVVALARGVGVEPGAHLLAERGFFRRVVEVHDLLLHLLPPLSRTPRRGGSLRRILLLQPADQLVLPGDRATQRERQDAGAAVMELGVGLPGEADAAMGL